MESDWYTVTQELPHDPPYVSINDNNTVYLFTDKHGRHGMIFTELTRAEVEALVEALHIMRM